MPELPEVETVRRGHVSFVVGRRIERVEVGRERTVRRTSRQALIDGLTGATITSIGRRGKYILCSLDTGDALMIHLRMSGRVLVSEAGSQRRPTTRMSCCTSARRRRRRSCGSSTRGRSARWSCSIPTHVAAELPELAELGIDPITDGLSVAQLAGMLRRRARQLKPLLLDQHVIAGIGNIYCDEILHRAKLRPDRLGEHAQARRDPPAARCDPLDPRHGDRGRWQHACRTRNTSTSWVTAAASSSTTGSTTAPANAASPAARPRSCALVSGGRSTCFCPRCQH